jgi:hypothetical protein
MSALFGNTTSIPGNISPGEFSLRSGQIGAAFAGGGGSQAFQEAANYKRQADQGAPPDRGQGNGYDPRSASGGETEPWKFM